MPTVARWNPSAIVSQQDAWTASGTGWRVANAADLPRLYDGVAGNYDLALVTNNGVNTYGWITLGFPAKTPATGVAWDGVNYSTGGGVVQSTIGFYQIRLISASDQTKSVLVFKQFGAGGGSVAGVTVNPKTGSNDLRTFLQNDVLAVIEADTGGGTYPQQFYVQFADFYLYANEYARPTLAVTGPSPVAGSTITNTARPNITWNFTGDGLPQAGYRVRIFTSAQYGIGGFNPLTSPATYDSGNVTSASTNHVPTSNLASGFTYRAYVWAWTKLPVSGYLHSTYEGITVVTLGQAAYSQFTLNLTPPPAPTALTPVAGATVSTDTPTLGATLTASTVAGTAVRAQWQLATDAGFTANVRTVTEAAADQRGSGATTEDIPAGASELFQGTWYLRARELDSNGVYGAYSGSQSFTVAHVPSVGSPSPSGQASRAGSSVTFSWVFSDPSPTDFQTAFQVIIERDSDGAVVVDSGKVTSTVQSYTYAIPAGYMDTLLRWRVRVYDSDNVVSAYTSNQQFTARTLPTVAITFPTTAITSPTPTITWTVTEPAGSGRTQTSYLVTITNAATGAQVYTSGWLAGADGSHTVSSPVLLFNVNYTVTVTVQDSAGIQGAASVTALASWTPPANPTVTVDTSAYDTGGYVRLTWPQNREQGFIAYKVYRRAAGAVGWTPLATITDVAPATYTYDDYTAPANQALEYAVTQTATIFGVSIEAAAAPNSVTPAGTNYWIVVPDNAALSVRLSSVHNDSFTDEWEQETINLIGRGRRVERGTHYGRNGSLGATVRDYYLPGTTVPALTARQIRLNLEAMKAGTTEVYLRTPFGDYWKVVVGDLQIERESGVGVNEWFSVTIPYIEVA